MCQHHVHHHHGNPAELVKKSRHRFEKPLFGLAALLTILTFIVVLALSFYKHETVGFVKETLVSEYRTANPDDAKLSDTEVLKKLSEDDKETLSTLENLHPGLVLLAPLAFLLLIIYNVGKSYGGVRANGVKVGPDQFPEVYAIWVEMAQQMGLKEIPELYVENGNGLLNAYATCLPGYRAFGAIYSDILERALANDDEKALRFILGHELGHIRLGHVMWWYHTLTIVGNLPGISYLIGLPLGRSREYGCDKLGYALSGDTEQQGLLMLAAGKHLYRRVDMAAYEKEYIHSRSFWATVHNFFGSHPNINWRIAALRQNRHGDLLIPKKPLP